MSKLIFIGFFISIVFIIISSLSPIHTSHIDSSTPISKSTNIGNLKKISFVQFKKGKKLWELSAESMEDKGDIVVLTSVLGSGISKDGESFSFSADTVELEKSDYSFVAYGNPKLIFSNKKVIGNKIIYNADKNIYIIFHGIIYINKKVSFSGNRIEFLPSLSKLIVGGKNENI